MKKEECKQCEQYKKERDIAIKRYKETFGKQFSELSDWEKAVIQQRLGIGYRRTEGEYHKSRKQVAAQWKATEERIKEVEEKAKNLLSK